MISVGALDRLDASTRDDGRAYARARAGCDRRVPRVGAADAGVARGFALANRAGRSKRPRRGRGECGELKARTR